MKYKKLLNSSLEMYFNGDYKKAYDFITENMDNVVGNQAQLENFRYCLLALEEDYEGSFKTLSSSIKDKGFWYAPEVLTEDDDLAELKSFEGFDELIDICKKRFEKSKQHTKYEVIYRPVDGKAEERPLLVALHGNQENMHIAEDDWSGHLKNNYDGLFIQSNDTDFHEAFEWDDYKKHAKAVVDVLDDYTDRKRVLGGFSAGCQVALWSVIEEDIPVDKLILMGPWLPDLDAWGDKINVLKDKKIEVHILCGDEDGDCFPCAKSLHEKLSSIEANVSFEIYEGLNHDFPDNFDERLEEIL